MQIQEKEGKIKEKKERKRKYDRKHTKRKDMHHKCCQEIAHNMSGKIHQVSKEIGYVLVEMQATLEWKSWNYLS